MVNYIYLFKGQSLAEYIAKNSEELKNTTINIKDEKEFKKYTFINSTNISSVGGKANHYKIKPNDYDTYTLSVSSFKDVVVDTKGTKRNVHYVTNVTLNGKTVYSYPLKETTLAILEHSNYKKPAEPGDE